MEEILDMYDDPEAYFTDRTRKVTERYKKDSIAHLKRRFRFLTADVITKVYTQNNGLFLLSVRDLLRVKGKNERRNSRRGDEECPLPGIKKSPQSYPTETSQQLFFCCS